MTDGRTDLDPAAAAKQRQKITCSHSCCFHACFVFPSKGGRLHSGHRGVFCRNTQTFKRRLLSKDYCPKTAVRRLLSEDYCTKTTIRRLLSKDYCPKTTVRRLLSEDYCPKTTVRRLLTEDCPRRPSKLQRLI